MTVPESPNVELWCRCGGVATPSGEFPGMWRCTACGKVFAERRFLTDEEPRPRIHAEEPCPECGSTNVAESGPVETALDVALVVAAVVENVPDAAVTALRRHHCRSCGAHF